MIELENLCFSYDKTTFLSDITANFKKGKFYGIIGPNGCGKTTLLKLISNILSPLSGNIIIDGKSISDYKRIEFAKKVAVMPQVRQIPDMTVYDFVACGRFPYLDLSRRLRENDKLKIEEALKITDTVNFKDKNIKNLSGGERQRAYIAMLYAQDTEYILCDEPTTFLDIGYSLSVTSLLKRLSNENKCVIAILHDISSALKFCDEILVINEGKAVCFDRPESIVSSGILTEVFGVSSKLVESEGNIDYIFNIT